MNENVTRGFLKEAGVGSFFRAAVGKVRSFFGGSGGSVGAQTVKLGPRPAMSRAAPAATATPKMQLIRGGGSSIPTTMRAPTPQQRMNSRIRSEMKRNDFTA